MVLTGYRPTFQCSSSSAYENITLTTNSSYFVSYDKCHIKVLYNDTAKKTHTLVKKTTCFEGYQYSLEKDRSYVTEVFVAVTVESLIFVGASFVDCLNFTDSWGRDFAYSLKPTKEI